ncbi:MAG: putative peptidase [Chlamydiales bacterium]|nr:putative peptidase [Chlamydiales bacterium]MCH9619619.1 putative peptidase [Chlamydiales bacterium]MCH9623225.1 putative peptidase [Chlamydiales bacterium]
MSRIGKVQKELEGIDALLIDDPTDLYYLTGLKLSLGRLLILPEKATLFVDGRYIEACQNQTDIAVQVWDWKTPFPLPPHLTVGFDGLTTSYAAYQKLSSLDAKWVSLEGPILKHRAIKDEEELEKLRAASQLGMEGLAHLLPLLKEGVTEKEMVIALKLFWTKAGAERVAFEPVIAFGEGSSQPHYHSTSKKLEKGETILIDIGVELNHYTSDMTRVFFLGEPDEKMKEIYTIVLKAQERALEKCRAGVTMGEIDQVARETIEKKGYQLPHGLGHGVGLQVHELPNFRITSETILQPNMVITVEPGIYLPKLGGVRIEDTIVIKKDGFENLTTVSKALGIDVFL